MKKKGGGRRDKNVKENTILFEVPCLGTVLMGQLGLFIIHVMYVL